MSQMLIPNTVTEACQMLSSGNRVACAGATNLYVDREKGKYLDRDIVSLHRLKELSGIREEKDGWHIGSLTTFDLIEDAFRGQGAMDALAEAASIVGRPPDPATEEPLAAIFCQLLRRRIPCRF